MRSGVCWTSTLKGCSGSYQLPACTGLSFPLVWLSSTPPQPWLANHADSPKERSNIPRTAREFRPTEEWWEMCMWLCFSYCLGWYHITSELIGVWEQRLSCWVMVWDAYWICAMSVIEEVLSAARLGIQSYSSMVSPAIILKQSVSQ